jgi:hypothetical protein
MIELLPCKYCHTAPVIHMLQTGEFTIECDNDYCKPCQSSDYYKSLEKAETQWNNLMKETT